MISSDFWNNRMKMSENDEWAKIWPIKNSQKLFVDLDKLIITFMPTNHYVQSNLFNLFDIFTLKIKLMWSLN